MKMELSQKGSSEVFEDAALSQHSGDLLVELFTANAPFFPLFFFCS